MERLQELFTLYYEKTASPEQKSELMHLIKTASTDQLNDLIRESGANLKKIDFTLSKDKADAILKHILDATRVEKNPPIIVRRITKWWRYAAAASVILIVSIGAYLFFMNRKIDHSSLAIVQFHTDVRPGKYKAKLTLADGRTIVLDSASFGAIAVQGNTSIINKNGQLEYNVKGSGGAVVYNIISTANGETYALTLADGSVITLNSASSIRFPVAFPGKERRIEITGEAYFRIAKNTKQPFLVSVNGMEVRDLGTEFNINAYNDEPTISTTLIEGSAEVSFPSPKGEGERRPDEPQSVILKPGQQAQLIAGHLKAVSNINLDEVIAWKKGYFHFESADLKTILKQLARWYNIKVTYQGPVGSDRFFSIMSRNTPLSVVLKSLQANGVKFKIEGNNVYVISG